MPAKRKVKSNSFITVPNDFFSDNKVLLLMEKFPGDGIVVYFKIRAFICMRGSYFIKWDDDTRLEYVKEMHETSSRYQAIIKLLLEYDLLDAFLFRELGILTSIYIQKEFLRFSKSHQEVLLYQNSLLLSHSEVLKRIIPGLKVLDNNGGVIKSFERKRAVSVKKSRLRKRYDRKSILLFVKIPWEERSSLFKRRNSQQMYGSYISFCKTLLINFKPLLESEYLITFEEYQKVFTELRLSAAELSVLLLQMCNQKIEFFTNIYDLLKEYVELRQVKSQPVSPVDHLNLITA